MKYQHIIDYLAATAGPSIENSGLSDERVNKRTEAGLCQSFRRYICGAPGDSGCDYFKVDGEGLLHVFNGRYFEMMLEETFLELIREVMERMNVGIVYQTGSAKVVMEYCLNRLRGDERCLFVPDRRYVCFRNGVYDLSSMRLTDFDVRYKTDVVLDFDYTEGAHSALWDKVLSTTVPDANMRETFHQFCGCFLASRTEYKIEHILFVVGEGQNGKSVICKAVVNMLGPEVASSYSPEQLFKSSQMEYHLADVNGKIVNYCDEVSNKDFSGGDFKQFVSGGAFTGRHPYSKRPTKVDRIPLMLCCANAIPPTTDDTEGYFRRFLIILAPNHVAERDKDPMLEMKLQAPEVKSAIFNWVLEGYRAFVSNGGKIEIAGSVKEVVDEMRANANSLRRWIDSQGYVAATPAGTTGYGWKPKKEWVQEYVRYCNDWNETPRNQKSLIDLFKKMGVASHRRADGIWYYMEQKVQAEVEPVLDNDDLPAGDGLPF